MTTWLITRHPGARDWAARQRLPIDRHCAHLDALAVEAGDTVIGSLPVHLAATVCAAGARYFNLSLDLPASARGKELTADELIAYNARLEEYRIQPAPVEPAWTNDPQGTQMNIRVLVWSQDIVAADRRLTRPSWQSSK